MNKTDRKTGMYTLLPPTPKEGAGVLLTEKENTLNEKERTHMKETPALFALGRIVATPGALSLLERHGMSPMLLISRHVGGDWGSLDPDDAAANDAAVSGGDRILSNYPIDGHDRVWIITEWDRTVTTLLLPCEY
jgi:hypothetical protein